jgi:inosine/xanthosine triphosphate pyrophosphatase family protein
MEGGSSDYGPQKKQVIKVKKHNVLTALQKAILSTQFEGLKVLTKDSILAAQKLLDGNPTNTTEYVPVGEDGDDENVGRFMLELGSWLQDQNQRFKITVKKKYINDILMMSKGAQNLA